MLKVISKQHLKTHTNTFIFQSRFSYVFRIIKSNFSIYLGSSNGSKDDEFFLEKYKDYFYFSENKLYENFLITLTLKFKSDPFTCIEICKRNEFALDFLLYIKPKLSVPHKRIQFSAYYLIRFEKDESPIYRSTKVNFLDIYTTERKQITEKNVLEIENLLNLTAEEVDYEEYIFTGLRITAQAVTK